MNNPGTPPGSPPDGSGGAPGAAPPQNWAPPQGAQPAAPPVAAPPAAAPPAAAPGYPPPGAMQPGPAPGYPQQAPQPGYPQPGGAPFTGEPTTNSLAIFGLILAFVAPCAMIGIVLSVVGMVQINNSQGAQKGKGLAIAGIAVGAFMFIVMMVGSALAPILVRM